MEVALVDWINLSLRWLHVLAGIAWIGTSFYFMWLDAGLKPATPPEHGVKGESWQVHGGGFYNMKKYTVAPAHMPETLHWFKWEAYTTWLSGFALLVGLYYLRADIYLIDASVMALTQAQAVGIGVASLILGWLVYDGLCRSPVGQRPLALAVAVFALVGLAAWGYAQVFGGRGAYIHTGALIGTIMVANVAMVIIPKQRKAVTALLAGETPDPALGAAGKQRSVHNNYLTLPVVFIMISNHYPMTYGHPYNWAILIGIGVVGALVRHWFNLRNAGEAGGQWIWPAAVAGMVAIIGGAAAWQPGAGASADAATGPVAFDEVTRVIDQRCATCHAAEPSQPGFTAPPGGLMLDTPERIREAADRIHAQAVASQVMPPGNITGLTEEERAVLARWVAGAE
ncbi:MAG: urate hydroxylase PuuD [Azospirillaceae bacterium]